MKSLIKYLKQYNIRNYKFLLILTVMSLTVIGVFLVGSAEPTLQSRQVMGAILGFTAMLVISLIDYNWVLRFKWILYVINVIFLIWVDIAGDRGGGAVRWLNLGFIRFQPSDLTKIIMVLFFAKFLMDHEEELNTLKGILICCALIAPSLVLIYMQPNLSTTICIAVLFFMLLFIGGLNYKLIGIGVAVAVPLIILFLVLVMREDQKLINNYQRERIMAYFDPDNYDYNDDNYQQDKAVMAIGSGQLNGKGLNNNTTTSVKNGNFIAAPETDFIFAIIGEELGFVGCCVVIFLLLLIVIQCIIIGIRSQNLSGQIICGGVASLIGVQSFINIGVATKLLPNTGLSLPFVSYGLTSIVCFFMGIGFVLNVGLQPKKH